MPSYQQGRWWQRRTEELAAHGYRLHWAIYNASQHGVPQNRPRLWAVGIRKDTPGAGEGFRGLEPLPADLCLTLADILGPREEGDTVEGLPTGQVAARNVKKAREEAESRGLTADWMVTQHVGQGWSQSVRPRLTMPCLLHSNKGGYWIGSRGRAARVSEHSRAQGLPAVGVRWPKDAVAFALLGNSMARPILQRLIHRILKGWGIVPGDLARPKRRSRRMRPGGRRPPLGPGCTR